MTNKQAVNILLNEQKCINRNDGTQCDRKCESCDLVMDAEPIREAYNMAISALQKQIPKKPVMGYAFLEKIREVIKRTDPERAESKTECCPVCGRTLGVSQFVKAQNGLRVGDHYCKRCGQAIDWEEE